jgi:hypothetical protein
MKIDLFREGIYDTAKLNCWSFYLLGRLLFFLDNMELKIKTL